MKEGVKIFRALTLVTLLLSFIFGLYIAFIANKQAWESGFGVDNVWFVYLAIVTFATFPFFVSWLVFANFKKLILLLLRIFRFVISPLAYIGGHGMKPEDQLNLEKLKVQVKSDSINIFDFVDPKIKNMSPEERRKSEKIFRFSFYVALLCWIVYLVYELILLFN